MQGVALHTPRETTLEMQMLLQIVKDCFNLRSTFQEFPLASGHELFLLFVMGWHYKDGAIHSMEFLVQGTVVATISDRYFRISVHKIWDSPAVAGDCTTEDVGTKLALIVHTGVQLKSVVLALPIMPSVGVAPGYAVILSSDQPADFQHGTVHEAQARFML